MKKFRIRYARVVVLETIVEAEVRDDIIDDGRLPGVYLDPLKDVPHAVDDVTDYEHIWEIEEIPESMWQYHNMPEQPVVFCRKEPSAPSQRRGSIRLGCRDCDRDDFDGVHDLPEDWSDVTRVQDYEASMKPRKFSNEPGQSCLDWQTHLGNCPDCQSQRHVD